MPWTKDDYINNYPAAPNPYSKSGEVHPSGQLTDEGAMLRAMSDYEALMACCICDWDLDMNDRPTNTPPPEGCPVHPGDDDDAAN